MALPIILFGLTVAVLIGVLFHLLRSGSGWRLLLYMGLSVIGSALGQSISMFSGYSLYKFGALDMGMSVIGSILVLAVGDWLSRIERKNGGSV